jgi:hypothetical protein
MARHDEAYAYQIIRQASLQSAAASTTPSERRRHLALASFTQRSARMIGAEA